ncbi:uncharacterized protein DUF2628 [Roseibium hamelinense]|uniref:Uncharacterized protein DUF2628 n=1 Tax=Roseibium hamelinense TaxID=150831 RepID=A0A562SNE4_9HYPH|nr:DUF2628 domain-containing protein [Roseibium hamelinense]MTI44372.1 DUF2628 domain-containing protein [Roseibium hamelinense]TWI82851.1 uncharacterized protein DUF2628 [Roseibium hamelinense]
MTTYFVMAPPGAATGRANFRTAEKYIFVPDRFSVPAFAFSLIWIVFHRMWLVLLGYLVLTLALEIAASAIGDLSPMVAAFAISAVFGLEAQALRRWSLERKGYSVVGMVCGSDQEEAELRFFRKLEAHPAATHVHRAAQPDASWSPAPGGIVPRVGREQVVGLTLRPEPRK